MAPDQEPRLDDTMDQEEPTAVQANQNGNQNQRPAGIEKMWKAMLRAVGEKLENGRTYKHSKKHRW